jgi:hypothetical protein
MMTFAEDGSPVLVEQYVISDKGYFVVCGTITVTNTGDVTTEGLFVTDTIQMWDGSCWIDIACVDVDLSCKPALCPGESYTYSYRVSFCLDNVAMIDFCENKLQNVAFAGASNYDDDEGVEGAFYYLPLEVPFLPEKVTMETSASLLLGERRSPRDPARIPRCASTPSSATTSSLRSPSAAKRSG